MKHKKLLLLLLFIFCFSMANAQQNISIFYKTAGFKHESIPTGIQALKEIAADNGWKVIATDDAEKFVSELSNIDAVIFLSTTGDIFTEDQQEKFTNYIENGGNVLIGQNRISVDIQSQQANPINSNIFFNCSNL